ncbi:MAG: sigma 54-interacting transcriptional regulator [Firmicutes bacterium]|nr:sigma 54-interacting transcriptional regulator [Bacillota bacterium]
MRQPGEDFIGNPPATPHGEIPTEAARRAQFQAILESAHNGIVAIDDRGLITIFNSAAERLVGKPAAEVLGKHITEIIPTTGLPEVLKTGQSQVGGKLFVNDRLCITNRTPIFASDGRVVGAVGIFQDVSELESISKELQSYKMISKELDAIIESSFDGIYVTDGKGVTTRVNSGYERITGLKRRQVLGRHMKDLVDAGFFDQSVTLIVLREKKSVTIMQEIRPTGKSVIVTGNPIYDEWGNIVGVVTNVRDLTELENLKTQLEETMRLSERYYSELQELRSQQLDVGHVVAQSAEMRKALDLAARVARVDSTVLILGESGVGKEVLAKTIHLRSRRRDGPFMKINCGAIPESLLESELFGYEGGAFTGARREGKIGLVEMAAGGTLFLDEVGELSTNLQVKLLRLLQEREIMKVGGSKEIQVDTRIIAATNRDLKKMVDEGRFREDLYYRLNVVMVRIPPLRERRDDIPPLVLNLLARLNSKYGLDKRISPRAMDRLIQYHWPGNVRELENVVEQAVVLTEGDVIEPESLPAAIISATSGPTGNAAPVSYRATMREAEKSLLLHALTTWGNPTKAAEALGMHRTTFIRKAARHKLNVPGEGRIVHI